MTNMANRVRMRNKGGFLWVDLELELEIPAVQGQDLYLSWNEKVFSTVVFFFPLKFGFFTSDFIHPFWMLKYGNFCINCGY